MGLLLDDLPISSIHVNPKVLGSTACPNSNPIPCQPEPWVGQGQTRVAAPLVVNCPTVKPASLRIRQIDKSNKTNGITHGICYGHKHMVQSLSKVMSNF